MKLIWPFKDWHCSGCNVSFGDKKALDKHYRDPKCLKVQELKQKSCHGNTGNRNAAKSGKLSTCGNCKMIFLTKKLLERHFDGSNTCNKLQHGPPTSEAQHICERCGKEFQSLLKMEK